MSKRAVPIFLLVILAVFQIESAAAQEAKMSISLMGGVLHTREYGSTEDYQLGENDFPVTPAHAPLSFGLALGYSIWKGLGAELDVRYHLSSSVTLEDPSDGDRITIDSSRHNTITANLVYRFGLGKFQPFLMTGIGIDTLVGEEQQTLTSDLGYEITLEPPEKKSVLVWNGGLGCIYMLSSRLGLRIDIRYVHISGTEEVPALNVVNAMAGLIIRF